MRRDLRRERSRWFMDSITVPRRLYVTNIEHAKVMEKILREERWKTSQVQQSILRVPIRVEVRRKVWV